MFLVIVLLDFYKFKVELDDLLEELIGYFGLALFTFGILEFIKVLVLLVRRYGI